jgi:Uma2 family endonuclease
MTTTTGMTLEEFLSLPEERPYAEFRHGEVRHKVSPSGDHQLVAKRIVLLLDAAFAGQGGLAIESLRIVFEDIDDPASYIPDIALYRNRRRMGRRHQYSAPDLCIEIRSPGQSLRLLREKCEYYIAHGARAAWLIDPGATTVELWEPERATTLLAEEATIRFDEFEMTVADLLDTSTYLDE